MLFVDMKHPRSPVLSTTHNLSKLDKINYIKRQKPKNLHLDGTLVDVYENKPGGGGAQVNRKDESDGFTYFLPKVMNQTMQASSTRATSKNFFTSCGITNSFQTNAKEEL